MTPLYQFGYKKIGFYLCLDENLKVRIVKKCFLLQIYNVFDLFIVIISFIKLFKSLKDLVDYLK